MELFLIFICAAAIVTASFFQIRLTMALIEKLRVQSVENKPTGWAEFDMYSKDYFERMMGGDGNGRS